MTFLGRPKRPNQNYLTRVACTRIVALWHKSDTLLLLRDHLRAQSLHRRDSRKFHDSTNSYSCILPSQLIFLLLISCAYFRMTGNSAALRPFPVLVKQSHDISLAYHNWNCEINWRLYSNKLTANLRDACPDNQVQFNGRHYDCWHMNQRRWTDSALWVDT